MSKARRSSLTTPFQHPLEVLDHAGRQVKESTGTQIWKEEIKLSVFTDSIIVYIENFKESMTKPDASKQL